MIYLIYLLYQRFFLLSSMGREWAREFVVCVLLCFVLVWLGILCVCYAGCEGERDRKREGGSALGWGDDAVVKRVYSAIQNGDLWTEISVHRCYYRCKSVCIREIQTNAHAQLNSTSLSLRLATFCRPLFGSIVWTMHFFRSIRLVRCHCHSIFCPMCIFSSLPLFCNAPFIIMVYLTLFFGESHVNCFYAQFFSHSQFRMRFGLVPPVMLLCLHLGAIQM